MFAGPGSRPALAPGAAPGGEPAPARVPQIKVLVLHAAPSDLEPIHLDSLLKSNAALLPQNGARTVLFEYEYKMTPARLLPARTRILAARCCSLLDTAKKRG